MTNEPGEKTKNSETSLVEHILHALRSIRYGYVQITVQDSKVVQIDKTEKVRFDAHNPNHKGGDYKNT